MRKNNKNRGFVRVFILLIAVILILSFLKIDLRTLLDSPTFKNNFDYLWGIGQYIWQNIILYPLGIILDMIVSVIPKR